ncbi:MAG: DUF362 domain-containing protein [Verrucomicrobiales bacterium]|nr:DUF362 domain-containing protein [Verrucomicrobiales bacterium]
MARLQTLLKRLLRGIIVLTGAAAATGAGFPPPATVTLPQTRARMVTVEAADSVVAFAANPVRIRQMVEAGLTNLARVDTIEAAWRRWIQPADVVGIKVVSVPGPLSGTRPAVVEALAASLIAVGQPATNIIVWDKHLANLRRAGFTELTNRLGIRVEGAVEAGYDAAAFYDNAIPGQLVWGDLEYQPGGESMGRRSHVTRLLTQTITRGINVTPLLNHNRVGVSGNLFSLAFGSVDNTQRFANEPERLAVAVPEIYALPDVGDRFVLSVVDALIAQYYGEEDSLLHYAAMLGQLRFSTDPVALDVLSIQELARQRELAGRPPQKVDPGPCNNAALLELGTSNPAWIQVEKVVLPGRTGPVEPPGPEPAPITPAAPPAPAGSP